MTFVTGLVVGLIIGWVIEWAIDLIFWRRDEGVLQQRLVEAEARIKELEMELANRQAAPPSVPQTVIREKDHLEKVNGIGPVFAKKLNNAGIFTFAELAAESPQRIREIINPQDWQKIEPEEWIDEARQIAQEAGKLIEAR
ncbi:MAG: hypothetical protein KDJ52_27520 [Anaerolineae bacterium]|nr:hypothetical protein [Anaerolineae bacterium]